MNASTVQDGDIDVRGCATSRATPAAVFALLKDSSTWPQWSMFVASGLERPGDHEREGVGAIKTFSSRVSRTRELITGLVPDRQLSYQLLSGFPFHNYHADVVLTPGSDGTRIDWTASFRCRTGTGWFWRMFMNRVLSDLAKQLAAAAERRSE